MHARSQIVGRYVRVHLLLGIDVDVPPAGFASHVIGRPLRYLETVAKMSGQYIIYYFHEKQEHFEMTNKRLSH